MPEVRSGSVGAGKTVGGEQLSWGLAKNLKN